MTRNGGKSTISALPVFVHDSSVMLGELVGREHNPDLSHKISNWGIEG